VVFELVYRDSKKRGRDVFLRWDMKMLIANAFKESNRLEICMCLVVESAFWYSGMLQILAKSKMAIHPLWSSEKTLLQGSVLKI
jgi:hypothetical protein